jgi:integrase
MGVKVRAWKGAWWIFIDHQGRRKAKRVGEGKEGQRAAQLAAEKIQARLVLGDFSLVEEPRPREITLEEYGHQWLATDVALRLKPATAEKYGAILRKHWLPELGKLPLSGITREKVKTILQGKLMEGMKPNMARIMLTVLRACLYAAVEEGRLTGNPAARVGKFIGRARVEVDIFIREELTRLLATAAQEMPEAYPLVLTLARTGLRIGEVLTLQPHDLDFERRKLWVQRTWGSRLKALGEQRINTPKSGRIRRVDMSQQLCEALEAYVGTSGGEPFAWLFPGREGYPMLPEHFRCLVWIPLLKRAGLRYRKPHTLRHTVASMLIQAGESLAYVKEQLGHSSITITVDAYGHLIPGANKAAVDRLDDATRRNPRATGVAGTLRVLKGGRA